MQNENAFDPFLAFTSEDEDKDTSGAVPGYFSDSDEDEVEPNDDDLGDLEDDDEEVPADIGLDEEEE